MDLTFLCGRWSVVKGRIREQVGKLIDDDALIIAGQRDQLVGRIQELYGFARDEAEQRVDRLVGAL